MIQVKPGLSPLLEPNQKAPSLAAIVFRIEILLGACMPEVGAKDPGETGRSRERWIEGCHVATSLGRFQGAIAAPFIPNLDSGRLQREAGGDIISVSLEPQGFTSRRV